MLPFPNRASLSITDLYNYDETLFDNITLPTEFDTTANRATLINQILMRAKDFEALYPDADFMKSQIKYWSDENIFVWDKIYALTKLEYNPIENYDRMEESSETGRNATERTGEAVSARAGSNSQNQSENRAESSTEAGSESNETKKAGYNTTTLDQRNEKGRLQHDDPRHAERPDREQQRAESGNDREYHNRNRNHDRDSDRTHKRKRKQQPQRIKDLKNSRQYRRDDPCTDAPGGPRNLPGFKPYSPDRRGFCYRILHYGLLKKGEHICLDSRGEICTRLTSDGFCRSLMNSAKIGRRPKPASTALSTRKSRKPRTR